MTGEETPGGGDERRLTAALAERELEDPRPLYRELLKELRSQDPVAYEDAVERYREEVVPAAEGDDPLAAWTTYGRWLAARVAPGRAVSIDRSGRSREPGDGAPAAACLLLHLPESTSRRAIALAIPSDPTEHQQQTRELLCG